MITTNNVDASAASGGAQSGLFAQPSEASPGDGRHDGQDAPAVEGGGEIVAGVSAHDADPAAHEPPDTAGDEAHEGDAAEGAAAAAQASVDALTGRGGETAASATASQPLSPSAKTLPDEDEPYSYADSTINVNLQLLPDDGDDEGREVIVAVSSHIEGPLVELTRLKLLGPLPPLLAELLKQHEERLPGLGAARDAERERAASRTSPAKSKTTVRGANGKTNSPAKTSAAATTSAAAPASGPVKPVTGEQTALFDLMTGHRPKDEGGVAGGGGEGPKDSGDAVDTPAASGGE